jgi:hypothetical protein
VKIPDDVQRLDASHCLILLDMERVKGWLALEEKPIPDGMIRVYDFYAEAGFHGLKTRKVTMTKEARKAVARARFIGYFAIGLTPPTSFSKQ